MEPLRLDPADPLASVLAWLAALARALGLDPATLVRPPQLNQVSAAFVRGCLADWSRQLRAIVCEQAERLAETLRSDVPPPASGLRPSPPPPPAGEDERSACSPAGGGAVERSETEGGRQAQKLFAVSTRRRTPRFGAARKPAAERSLDVLLDPDEEAALSRRHRAVLAALRDPSGLIRRLARRLARAKAVRSPERRRFPPPPRALGAPLRDRAQEPEPRPPDPPRSAPWPESAPRGCRGGGAGACLPALNLQLMRKLTVDLALLGVLGGATSSPPRAPRTPRGRCASDPNPLLFHSPPRKSRPFSPAVPLATA